MRISDWSSDVFSSDLIGPWVIPIEALLPYGHKTETQATAADYLRHEGKWTFDIGLEVHLQSAEMRRRGIAPVRITKSKHANMYWDTEQLLAHFTRSEERSVGEECVSTGR